MSIKVKSGGAYADIVGAFVKQGGVYGAASVFAKVEGAYQAVGGGAQTIGGIAIGEAGATGTIYDGFTLSDGDDFNSLSLVSAANPSGDYFATRSYRSPGGSGPAPGLRAPPTGALAVMHDVSPDYTGWQDRGRGVAQNYDSHIVSSGVLELKAKRQSAEEQVNLATALPGQIERGAMIHTAGRLWWNSPAVIEWRARFPKGPAGQHPTVWALSTQPPGGVMTGNEYGYEGSGQDQQSYHGRWTDGSASFVGIQNLLDVYRDGNFHTFSVVLGTTDYKYYVDGVLVNTIAQDPDVPGNKADYALITNHVYNAEFLGENYIPSEWAAAPDGVKIEVDWMRVWRPTSSGAHYAPLTLIPDTLISHGATSSIVLPSQTALWGATGLTEYVFAIPNEVEEPGGSNTGSYNQFPTGVTYDAVTRTISIANTLTGSGCLHFAIGVTGDGITCKPARFRLFVAPRWVGAGSYSWVEDEPVSVDIYPSWDMGRLFSTAPNPKRIAVTGLPTGLSFNSETGLIAGTPTNVSSGNITITATNSAGQTTSRTQPYLVESSEAGEGVPAPTLTGSPSLLASWDFDNAALLTVDGTRITSAGGSDGTSYTLASTGTERPVLQDVSGKKTARFFASELRNLRAVSDLGVTGACTIVVVCQAFDTTTTVAVADLATATAAFTSSRRTLIASTSSGYQARKHDASNVQSIAAQGSAYDANLKLLVGTFPGGAAVAAALNVNGQGSEISGSPVSNQPPTPTQFTLGANSFTGGLERFANISIWRVLVYGAALNSTQREEIAVWANSNYGTPNNA